ncbi:MAG TPA: rRNA maturation RNase YbeY [Lactobacillaceae bacterium]|jgi:probable rRNA maturation factor
MDLVLIDETPKGVSQFHLDLVTNVLEYAGNYIKLPEDTEMSVTFMDNEKIHQFNKDYRGVDKPTDVISFAIEDGDEALIFDEDDAPALNIGDILVSVDKVGEQAEFLNHSWERELGFLVVHGFLHLNGYDHELGDKEEAEMFDLQREILDNYGLTR